MKTTKLVVGILLGYLSCPAQSISQSVITASGNSIIGTNVILDYTVGEIAIATLSGTNHFLTQGYLQPSGSTAQGLTNVEFKGLSVYPNPCNGTLYINEALKKIHSISIYDGSGKLIVKSHLTTLDISGIPAGAYLVTAQFEDNSIKTTEITKQ